MCNFIFHLLVFAIHQFLQNSSGKLNLNSNDEFVNSR